jgi:hypothetical protein
MRHRRRSAGAWLSRPDVIRSLPLEPQPTARQTREILFHVGHELAALGARVDHSLIGGFRFRMPPTWALASGAPRFFLAVSAGRVTIGANAGDPWQVRYELKFTGLLFLVASISVLLILIGIPGWPRLRLLDSELALWMIAYVLPYFLADLRFRRWLARTCAAAPVTKPPARGLIPSP